MKEEKIPEELPEPAPAITPEMIQTVYKLLESEGILYSTPKGVYIPTERGWKLLMETRTFEDEIKAFGDERLTLKDENEIEITKDDEIRPSTVGIGANKGASELKDKVKEALKQGCRVEIEIEAGGKVERIEGFGSPALTFESDKKIRIRKDDEIDGATIAILANKSARELGEGLKEEIKKRKEIRIRIRTKV